MSLPSIASGLAGIARPCDDHVAIAPSTSAGRHLLVDPLPARESDNAMEVVMLFAPTGRLGWDPIAEMRRMQHDMNRLFADFDSRPDAGTFPPINLWVGDGSVVVTAELAGIAEKDIDLAVREDTLTIQGKREAAAAENAAWHRRERAYGGFSRVVELPFRIDPDKVQARFGNGLLEVELQRPEADKPKRIRITAS